MNSQQTIVNYYIQLTDLNRGEGLSTVIKFTGFLCSFFAFRIIMFPINIIAFLHCYNVVVNNTFIYIIIICDAVFSKTRDNANIYYVFFVFRDATFYRKVILNNTDHIVIGEVNFINITLYLPSTNNEYRLVRNLQKGTFDT